MYGLGQLGVYGTGLGVLGAGWIGVGAVLGGMNGLGAWYMGWVYGQSAGYGVVVWTGLGNIGNMGWGRGLFGICDMHQVQIYASMTDRMACVT